jgi:hypothetical protein
MPLFIGSKAVHNSHATKMTTKVTTKKLLIRTLLLLSDTKEGARVELLLRPMVAMPPPPPQFPKVVKEYA